MSETRHSVCALDCPDACSLLVSIENGHAVRLRGNPAHPVTRGFLCGKVARYLEREYSPDRLLYPQRRIAAKGEGRFQKISWDEALDGIADRLKEIVAQHGAESVLPYSYGGSMGLLNGSGMDRRFFHRLGASRLDRTICASAGAAGLTEALGFRYGTDPEQFRDARLIVAWGANTLGTNVHLWPFIVEARRQGARFYTIDPRLSRTGKVADKHFFIHPGSDTALALGLMHVILGERLEDSHYIAAHTSGIAGLAARVKDYPPERVAALTGIPKDDIVALAREYATTRPAVIRINYGLQRSERGAMAVRAISLLPALTGGWKQPGGGLLLTTSGAFQLDRQGLERPDLGPPARTLNMTLLGQALTEQDQPPVKALVVYNSNPAAVAPNRNLVLQGLRRTDLFTVVIEQFQTDTADYADILLPATTFLEHKDLYTAYGHYYLQLARPALAPPGEARSNVEIFRLLASRMGFSDAAFQETEDEMIRALLASGSPFLEGITFERLEREHFVRVRMPEPFLPFAAGGFGTASGKCEFHAETLDYTPPVESRLGDPALRARYPLELISPKADGALNSTFGNWAELDEEAAIVTIHPTDAAARGISSGHMVRLHNQRGTCRLKARVEESVPAGVVSAPAVRWAKCAGDGHNVNVLTSDRLTDAGGGATFYSCLVEVEPLSAAS